MASSAKCLFSVYQTVMAPQICSARVTIMMSHFSSNQLKITLPNSNLQPGWRQLYGLPGHYCWWDEFQVSLLLSHQQPYNCGVVPKTCTRMGCMRGTIKWRMDWTAISSFPASNRLPTICIGTVLDHCSMTVPDTWIPSDLASIWF